MDQIPIDNHGIVVTASRAPEPLSQSAASVSILDNKRIERLGEPLVPALLRLVPSTAVASSGPAGSLTEVRIRGAEAFHSLLFIDGIRANDPAAGNAPRFELLNADLVSRIELVRGPQSALWGSEGIGGVIAITGEDGAVPAWSAMSEAGSFGLRRASASASLSPGPARIAVGIGWQRADGIDIFGGGDRDGYRNLSARLRASWSLSPLVEASLSAFALSGRSEFDGNDPVTFVRTHDLHSRNRLAAGRMAVQIGSEASPWRGYLAASLLGSSNRNFFEGSPINDTSGGRATVNGQVERRFTAGGADHRLIAALDHQSEDFRARDTLFGGFTVQDRERQQQSVTLEWRARAGPLVAGAAVRHDRFNRFRDATSLRLSGHAEVGGGFSVAASYGEGIAQPTFFDLYGFFPGSFVGNPSLRPESSRGVEVSARFRRDGFQASLTGYRQRLSDEIVDIFDGPVSTTVNRADKSRRSGIEAEAGWSLGDALRLTANYSFLKASEPRSAAGAPVREIRRPKHSGSLALDGAGGRFSYGAAIAFAGARRDTNFDVFPAQAVRLGSYWLGSARVAYAVSARAQLFVRAANALDQTYQDVFGYRTEGRSLHAGIRLADRR